MNQKARRNTRTSANAKGPTSQSSGGTARDSFLAFKPLNYWLLGAALVVVVLGYILLNQGSVTAAPFLLVLGYCVLIPAAFIVGLRGPREDSGDPEEPPD